MGRKTISTGIMKLLAGMLIVMAWACSEDEPVIKENSTPNTNNPTEEPAVQAPVTLSIDVLTFDALEAESKSIEVQCEGKFDVSVEIAQGDEEWISARQDSLNSKLIVLTVNSVNTRESERTAIMKVKSGTQQATATITQKPLSDDTDLTSVLGPQMVAHLNNQHYGSDGKVYYGDLQYCYDLHIYNQYGVAVEIPSYNVMMYFPNLHSISPHGPGHLVLKNSDNIDLRKTPKMERLLASYECEEPGTVVNLESAPDLYYLRLENLGGNVLDLSDAPKLHLIDILNSNVEALKLDGLLVRSLSLENLPLESIDLSKAKINFDDFYFHLDNLKGKDGNFFVYVTQEQKDNFVNYSGHHDFGGWYTSDGYVRQRLVVIGEEPDPYDNFFIQCLISPYPGWMRISSLHFREEPINTWFYLTYTDAPDVPLITKQATYKENKNAYFNYEDIYFEDLTIGKSYNVYLKAQMADGTILTRRVASNKQIPEFEAPVVKLTSVTPTTDEPQYTHSFKFSYDCSPSGMPAAKSVMFIFGTSPNVTVENAVGCTKEQNYYAHSAEASVPNIVGNTTYYVRAVAVWDKRYSTEYIYSDPVQVTTGNQKLNVNLVYGETVTHLIDAKLIGGGMTMCVKAFSAKATYDPPVECDYAYFETNSFGDFAASTVTPGSISIKKDDSHITYYLNRDQSSPKIKIRAVVEKNGIKYYSNWSEEKLF